MVPYSRPLVRRALERAGLQHIAARVLGGETLGEEDFARLRTADLLAVAALADLVREQGQGDEVALVDLGESPASALEGAVFAQPELGVTDGATGIDVLREVALVRLATPAARAIAVSFDALGEGLAQAALTFGASVLVGTMTRTKKADLLGRVERAGRRVRLGVMP